jgi:N6-L-threonylcarbamoyladenine synthase
LLVSGGHTELIKVDVEHNYHRLGRSHDDAAGEAFDKVARLLGLSYPGGPAIQKIAKSGDPKRFLFPKGRVSKPEGGFYPYDFSFSGLKTAVFRQIDKLKSENKELPSEDIAASFENVVAEVLVERSLRCALDQGLNSLVLVGGVAANERLRQMMIEKASENAINITLAPMEFCTDNAAMIGAAALLRLSSGHNQSSMELGVSARWPLEKSDLLYDLSPPF